ncbi:MAG TPA: enoyl-CoA hydratase-related protein [Pseudonocardiaceae bacterium]|nr:enoyl-CoA hydratase-related protein [Pseudonocardiaceae bacterium]
MDELRLTIDDRIATLTIDRPQRRNAMNYEMWSALPDLMEQVRTAPDVRVLVVRGGGEHFSAGADISEFSTRRNGLDGARRYVDAVGRGERSIATLPIPTIAAVTGFCIGAGCEMALACDMRIAAADSRFGITPANLGIVYSFVSTRQLVATVGPAWAKQILCGGELIDAPTALRIGLANELHPADGLAARVAELADTLATRAQGSVRSAKQMVNEILDGQDEESDADRALYDEAALSADYVEGVAAFLAKRKPKF